MRRSLLLLLALGGVARADGVEAGGFLGAHLVSSSIELGVADGAAGAHPESSFAFGLRVSLPVFARLRVEAEAAGVPTVDGLVGNGAFVFGLRLHALWAFGGSAVRPYLLAGAGVIGVLPVSGAVLARDVDFAPSWGGGVAVPLRGVLLRVDVRHILAPTTDSRWLTQDFEATVGLGVRFGAAARPAPALKIAALPPPPVAPPPPPPPPPLEPTSAPATVPVEPLPPPPAGGDIDADGVADENDLCPGDAEDRDGTEDGDGCPDVDNDGDGLADKIDDCPDQPETKNGLSDDDGCPDGTLIVSGLEFAPGGAVIVAASLPALDPAAALLLAGGQLRVIVAGYAAGPLRKKAEELGRRRAESVRAALVARGVDVARVGVAGHPVADAREERVEIRVLE